MSKSSVVKKEIVINGMTIQVIKKNVPTYKLIEEGIITERDAEMDKRARAAVSSAIRHAKICGKPIALYDSKKREPYIVNASGERIELE